MKRYTFHDTVKNETLKYIEADNEHDAWVLLTQRHSAMGNGAIRYEDVKERYKLLYVSDN